MTNDDLNDLFEEDWPENHRSGVVGVVGRPNVGKSTLINRILGQKIAIVSPKPQTTRSRQLGIYTEEAGQILFADTPGLHRPHNKLGEYMVDVAERVIGDADALLWVLDASEPPQEPDKYIAETLQQMRRPDKPLILALNKRDLVTDPAALAEHLALIDHTATFEVSATEGTNVNDLVQDLLARMPLGPRYYPAEQVSEVNLRFMAAEIIREKIILNTEQEIPYAVAIEIEEFKERDDAPSYVNANIYVERDSQRGIIIGKGGAMIKRIGMQARKEMEREMDMRVYLDLHVKVLKNWRSDAPLLRRLGYFLPREDKR